MNNKENDNRTLNDEIREGIVRFYQRFSSWMRPKKTHPLALQILLFIIKIPILLLILLLSPVVIFILILVFIITL
jgi:ABC-type transport system involved in cytochrome bd biosynthesis fused ATPase/permease subunit